MRTIEKIITKVESKYGAPMGRSDLHPNYPYAIVNIGAPHNYLVNKNTKESKVIFDCAVPLDSGAYDKGGAYWGFPSNLRVRYTKDLTFVEFYRTY